jgi:hypothetical protein
MPEETTTTEDTNTLQDAENYLAKVEILSAATGQSIQSVQGTYDETVLDILDVSDVKAVQQVTKLADCAKNLPNALATLAIRKGLTYLNSLPITGTALDLVQILGLVQRIYKQYQVILQLIEMLKDPETLLMMLANAKILEGQSLLDKIDEIKTKFPGVPGLDNVLNQLDELDLCNSTDFSLTGALLGGAKKLPIDKIPEAVKRMGNVVTDNLDRTAKDGYNVLMFKVREGTLKDETYLAKLRAEGNIAKLNQYNEMLTLVNVLAYSYHDDIKKTGDISQYAALQRKYNQNVETELSKYSNTWDSEIIKDFKVRTNTVGTAISNEGDSIKSFYNPQPPGTIPSNSTTGDYGGLSKATFDMIVYYEVGSQSQYTSKYAKPTWPGGASGVTIGIGYDLGYNTTSTLISDWSGVISDSDINRLSKCIGLKGSSAKSAVSNVSDITIPWDAAILVYKNKTLPRFTKECLRAFPGADKLHPDAFGALVSLVFNRGPSTSGKNREEMANIRAVVSGQKKVDNIYAYIADQIVAMKRIWANTNLTGLLVRRDKEAAFVRSASGSSNNVA